MKRILYIIALMLGIEVALAEDNFVLITHNDPVCIYPSAFATRPNRIIQQIDELEVLYAFKVIDDSLFRFKVQIYEPYRICGKDYDSLYTSTGWIDKINTTVFMRSTCHDDGVYIKLYEAPKLVSKYTKIAENDDFECEAYVDKIRDKWYHINFVYHDSLFSGWTPIYCVNPYGCN